MALILLVLIYIACLIWLAKESAKKSALETKRDLILGRLSSNSWIEMGFDSAKKVLGEDCSDEEIHKVIQAFPKSLRFVRLRIRNGDNIIVKDEQGNDTFKAGIGMVKAERI